MHSTIYIRGENRVLPRDRKSGDPSKLTTAVKRNGINAFSSNSCSAEKTTHREKKHLMMLRCVISYPAHNQYPTSNFSLLIMTRLRSSHSRGENLLYCTVPWGVSTSTEKKRKDICTRKIGS